MPARASASSTSPECTTPPRLSRFAAIRSGYTASFSHHPRQPRQREIQRHRRIRRDRPLDAGMADVALVPQRHVLQRRHHRGAHHARQPGQVLAQHRVALVRHRRGALLPGMEELLRLPHLAALQMAHLGRQPLDAATRSPPSVAEIRRVPVARDHLRGNRLRRQPQLLRDILLHPRIEMRERADRAADRRHRDLRPRRHQPRAVARELGIVPGELQAEASSARRGCRGCGRWSACACARTPAPSAPPAPRRDPPAAGRSPASAAPTGRCPARRELVMPRCTKRLSSPDRLGEPGQEGDHVVPGLALDRVDPVDVGLADRRQPSRRPSRGWCARRSPGWRRRAPCPRRPAPRSRTRCDSGCRAPRWPPSPVGCNAEPSLPCPVLGARPARPLQPSA